MAARILVFGETPEPAVGPDRPAGRSLGEDWRAGKWGLIYTDYFNVSANWKQTGGHQTGAPNWGTGQR